MPRFLPQYCPFTPPAAAFLLLLHPQADAILTLLCVSCCRLYLLRGCFRRRALAIATLTRKVAAACYVTPPASVGLQRAMPARGARDFSHAAAPPRDAAAHARCRDVSRVRRRQSESAHASNIFRYFPLAAARAGAAQCKAVHSHGAHRARCCSATMIILLARYCHAACYARHGHARAFMMRDASGARAIIRAPSTLHARCHAATLLLLSPAATASSTSPPSPTTSACCPTPTICTAAAAGALLYSTRCRFSLPR